MTAPRSRTGKQLAKAALAAGWTVLTRRGTGHTRINDPDRPTCHCGTRHDHHINVPCQSEGLFLSSPGDRYLAITILITTDGKSWTATDCKLLDRATPDQHGNTWPREIGTRALLAHLNP